MTEIVVLLRIVSRIRGERNGIEMENLFAGRYHSSVVVLGNALLVCFYWDNKCCARCGKTLVLGVCHSICR